MILLTLKNDTSLLVLIMFVLLVSVIVSLILNVSSNQSDFPLYFIRTFPYLQQI